MDYKTKSLSEIKQTCLEQEALIQKLLKLVRAESIDTAIIINDYGVLKTRLMYTIRLHKKATVKRNTTPEEIAYYFSMAIDVHAELKVPIRGKIDSYFIETLNTALNLTQKYLSKIVSAEV